MTNQIFVHIDEALRAENIAGQLRAHGLAVASRQSARNMDALASTLVVTGANVLVAVLNVVFSYLQARKSGKIVVQSVDGWRVEIPSDTARSDLQELVEMASTRRIQQITVCDTMPNKSDGDG